MTRRSVLLGVFILLLTVSGAFALLPYEIAEHRTTVNGSTGTAVAGNATAGLDGPVAVYVDGPGWTATAVGHYLVGDLRAAGAGASQVSTIEDSEGPLLAVRILDLDTNYQPLSPTATVRWRFVYVASGNASLAREQLATEHGPVIGSDRERFVVEGQYTLRNDVRGVITIPAYRQGIADRIASTTVEKLQAAA